MKKITYQLGILFLVVAVAAGALHSVLLLVQGFSMVFLQTYAHWYLLSCIVFFLSHLFVLHYFYVRKWKFVFIAACVSIALFLIHATMQYYILINVARHLAGLHSMLALLSVASTIVFAATLISQARRYKLLVWLAALTIIVGIAMIGVLAALMNGVPGESLVRVLLFLVIIPNLFPLFYIVLFWREAKLLPQQPLSSNAEQIFNNAAGAIGMITMLALLFIGIQLSQESYWHVKWQSEGGAETRKLAERFETRTYVNEKNDTLRYLLLKPLNYDSTKKYPLVTCLHGGPTRVAKSLEITQPAPLLSEPYNRKKYPAFLFVPQARPGVLWGGIPAVPSMGTIVSEAMEEIEKEFSIDEDRRYITGISGGGYGTWFYISEYPERFAAAMPICGSGDPALADKIIHVPVWAFHGDADRNVSVTGSRDMIEAIRKAGGNPKYNEYPNVGHNVWPEIEKTEGVLDWMFAQRRGSTH